MTRSPCKLKQWKCVVLRCFKSGFHEQHTNQHVCLSGGPKRKCFLAFIRSLLEFPIYLGSWFSPIRKACSGNWVFLMSIQLPLLSVSFFHYVGHAQREPWSVLYFKVGQLGTLILSSNLALLFYCIRACIHRIHRMAVTWAFCRRKYLMPTKPEWLNLCKHSLPLIAAKFLTHSFAY